MICPYCVKRITKGEVITIIDSDCVKGKLIQKAKPLNYHKSCWIEVKLGHRYGGGEV
jgi:hypothetical protein